MSLLLALTGGGAPTNYQITADAGSYVVSGQTATILKSKLVTGGTGSYSVSGQSANLLKSKLVTALAGAYSVSGQNATITYTPVGAYVITAEAGAYVVSGKDITITKTSNTPNQSNSGGWLGPNIRRKTRKESYKEREKLRLKIQDVEKVAENIVNISIIHEKIVDTPEIIIHNRPDVADLVSKLMSELRVSVKSPDYTRAIQAALEAKRLKEAKRIRALQDDEDILMLLMS